MAARRCSVWRTRSRPTRRLASHCTCASSSTRTWVAERGLPPDSKPLLDPTYRMVFAEYFSCFAWQPGNDQAGYDRCLQVTTRDPNWTAGTPAVVGFVLIGGARDVAGRLVTSASSSNHSQQQQQRQFWWRWCGWKRCWWWWEWWWCCCRTPFTRQRRPRAHARNPRMPLYAASYTPATLSRHPTTQQPYNTGARRATHRGPTTPSTAHR